MELFFVKTVNNLLPKNSIADLWTGSKYTLKLVEYNLNIYLMLLELKKMIFILRSLHMTFFFIYN